MTLSLKREGTTSRAYPSDSQLSKLGSLSVGWSTISAKNNVCRSYLHIANGFEFYCTLTSEEVEAIENVIERASVFENEENFRQKQLFHNHNNLLSKATGNGVTCCILCAMQFKGSRQKCLVCHDCGKKMCSKCTSSYNLKQDSTIALCKICCSQRELWKRTGAWFSGKLPSDSSSLAPERLENQSFETMESDNVFYSPEVIGENVSYSSSDDEDNTSIALSTPISYSDTNSVNDIQLTKFPTTALKQTLPKQVVSTSSLSCYNTLTPWFDKCKLSTERSVDPVASRLCKTRGKNLQRQKSFDEIDSIGGGQSPSPTPEEMKATSEGSDIELRQARSISLPPISSVPSIKPRKLAVDGSWPSITKAKSLPFTLRKFTSADTCGSIEFSIQYNKETSELTIRIIKCQDLPPADANGYSDPYVVMYLSFSPKHSKRSTKVVYSNLNPVFNDEKVYHGISPSNIRHSDLVLMVYDYDVISKDDFLGAASLPLRRALHDDIMTFQLPLKSQYPSSMCATGGDTRGQVLISLRYCTSARSLVVNVVKASRLNPIHTLANANPYVKVYLLRDRCVELKRKTTAVAGTLNPEYNEEIYIPYDLKKLQNRQLKIAVWNHSKPKRNIIIGSASLSCNDSVYEVLGNALSSPDKTSSEWITLS